MGDVKPDYPKLSKIDFTRDLIGTFYVKNDFKKTQDFMKKYLENQTSSFFKENSNSFYSCMIFDEIVPEG